MLQAIRSRAGSLVVKVLFAVLIVAFGFWGIGSWINERNVDTTIATVGRVKIPAQQLTAAVRTQVQTLRQTYGPSFDIEQAKQLGIIGDQLDQLINDSLVDQEVGRLRLAVGDDAVRALILGDPLFKGLGGQFDRQRYQQILSDNRMSEGQYEASVRNQLVRGALSDAVGSAGSAPKPLVDALYRMIAEKRVADTVLIPFASATDLGEPGETDLAEFHDQHSELFRAPELRSFEVAFLGLDDLAQKIAIPDDEVMDEYQHRLDEFKMPDRRHIEQILVHDQATADQVEAALKGGRAFAAVAKDVAKLPSGPVDLGLVSAAELPDPKLADAAFKLEKDGISEPIKTAFGWHVLHVTEIAPAKTEAFETVKPKLAAELARDAADRQMSKLANKVDDALARGDDLDKVAADLQLKLVKASDVDQTGHAVNGGEVVLPQPPGDILRTAFNTEAGQVSNVSETSDGGFYVVRVDKVTPSAVRPLAEVRDQALSAWQQDQRIQRVSKIAKEIVDAVNGGASLKQVAARRGLAVATTPPLERGRETGGLPPPVITGLFRAKPHQAVQGPASDGIYVAELTEVIAADPATSKADVDKLAGQLGQQIQGDLFAEFTGALRGHFPVEIDQSHLDRAF